MSAAEPKVRVYRLPALTYVVVLFLFFGAIPLAFAANGTQGAPARAGLQTLILLIPIIAAVFVARSATVVGAAGILVRAPLGKRLLRWDDLRGLSVTGRNVYAVGRDGAIRLPCVRTTNLGEITRASGGRLPEMADAKPKYAPQRRRSR